MMRRTLATTAVLPFLICLSVLGQDLPEATIVVSAGGEDPVEMTGSAIDQGDGSLRFDGIVEGADDWTITWSISVIPDLIEDELQGGNVIVDNDMGEPFDFDFRIDIPMCPVIDNGSIMGGQVTLIMAADADGGALTSRPGLPIWAARLDGSAAYTLFQDPFDLNASGQGTLMTNAGFGEPYPSQPGPPVEATYGIRLTGTLTSGESLTASSFLLIGADPENLVPCDDDDDADTQTGGEAAGDRFGSVVRLVGDVDGDACDDFAIGALRNDDAGSDAGKVYVHSGCSGDLIITVTGEAAGDRFGGAIAAGDDYNDDGYAEFLVGASHHGDGNSGAFYVIDGATGTVLSKEVGQANGDKMGYALAGGLDMDGDGLADYAAASPWHDQAGNNAGEIYVYSGATGARFATRRGDTGDRFGWALAMIGDIDGDGLSELAVGALFHDAAAPNAGRVAIYASPNSSLHTAVLGNAEGERFGHSIAGVGDVNGDERADLVVGAPFAPRNSMRRAGRVVAISGDDGASFWIRRGNAGGDRLGWAVAAAGDVNGDGEPDVLLAAPWVDDAASNAGRVYVRGGLSAQTLAVIDGEAAGDRFGHALDCIAAGGGGTEDALVGAPFHDDPEANAGRAYRLAFGAEASAPGSGHVDGRSVPLGNANGCVSDLDGDGLVDGHDLVMLLGAGGDAESALSILVAWGLCP